MKLTKTIALMLAALLAFAMPFTAMAEAADTELEGFVTELVEGGFIMEDVELGQIMLNVDDATVLDGILQEEEIAVGQYVMVQYDGRTTRSLPPQAHADRVGCYVLNGVVGEFMEDGILLVGDELYGDVIVHIEGTMKHIYPNVPITVYYNGVMAMSLPGQVAAREIIVPELTGTVSELDEEGFMLTDAEGAEYRVLMNESTLVGRLLPTEDEIMDEADKAVSDSTEAEADKAATDSAEGENDNATSDSAEGETEADKAASDSAEAETDNTVSDSAEADKAASDSAEGETGEMTASTAAQQADEPAANPDELAADAEADDSMQADTEPFISVPTDIDYTSPLKNGDIVTVYYNGELGNGLTDSTEALIDGGTDADDEDDAAVTADPNASEAATDEAATDEAAADEVNAEDNADEDKAAEAEASIDEAAGDYPMQLIALEVIAVETVTAE